MKAFISPDTTTRSLVILAEGTYKLQKVDVIFPVLHGMNGEDGTVQGLFELSKIPYVGCGVLASAVSMDKVYTKIIVDHIGIDQAKFVHVRESDFEHLEEAMDRVEKEIPYPIFVKPSCAGSSKGVSKAENRKELEAALYEAVKHDRNILCEETIVGREVECAVLGDRTQVKSTCVGEILAAEEAAFYDFDAKYNNAESKTVVDPEMPEESKRKIKEDAEAIFRAVDEECIECRRYFDYCEHILPALWIDDDFLNNEKLEFDYEKFELIDTGIKYLNPKHFSVKSFVEYCRFSKE